MGEISNIVSVTIARGTQTVSQVGFGTPLIFGVHTRTTDEIVEYNSLDEVAVDFQNTDAEYLKAQALFAQNPRPTSVKIGKRGAAEDVDTGLARISLIDNDWYFVILTSNVEADIKNCAAYIETKLKLYAAMSDDSNIITSATDDLASDLQDLNYYRTFLIYTSDTTDHKDAAWVGKMAPKDPGSATWKFKTLSGVTAETLTTSEYNYAIDKACNVYTEVGGVSITEDGVISSGEFIDIVRGTDWIQARIEENVYSGLVNVDKIAYTNAGIDVIKSKISAILRQAIDNGILTNDPAPVVTAPDISEVSTSDKSNRILRDIDFTATFAGAIHKPIISGKISV